MQDNNCRTTKFTTKDLVTTGIFSAIIILLTFIAGMPFSINPILTFFMPISAALLAGPPFLLLIAKTKKRGIISILGILMAILCLITGMHWTMSAGFVIYCLLGDFIAGIKGYKNSWLNILSYMLYALGTTGPYITFFLAKDQYMSYMLKAGDNSDYLEQMSSAGELWVLPVMLFGTLLVSFFSGLAGKKLLKKQFEKAGIAK